MKLRYSFFSLFRPGRLLFTVAVVSQFMALAQQPGTIDAGFNPFEFGFGHNPGLNGVAKVAVTQPDGKILVGGNFSAYNSISRYNIARLNTDGSLDTGFGAGLGAGGVGIASEVTEIAVQADGKVLIAGRFTHYNGVPRNNIARLNTDGSLDVTFQPGSGPDNILNGLELLNDGRIMISGSFNSYNGVTRKQLARLMPDGSLDNSFVFNLPASFPMWIYDIAVQPDNKVIVGGAGGGVLNNIIRLKLNGNLDTQFKLDTGFNYVVNDLLLQPDGRLLVAGGLYDQSTFTGYPVYRLHTNGSRDAAFTPPAGATGDYVALQTDGKILYSIGIGSSSWNIYSSKVSRLQTNGVPDPFFAIGTTQSGTVSMLTTANGEILIAGNFYTYNGSSNNGSGSYNLLRLSPNGHVDIAFNPGSTTGLFNKVMAMGLQPDGKIVIGGEFNSQGNATAHLSRLNPDGTLDGAFLPFAGNYTLGNVSAIAVQPDGKILVGGSFNSYSGAPYKGIARLNTNGTLDTTFNPGTGKANGSIWTIALQPDGKVIAGGDFTSFNGSPYRRLVRLNSDGSVDTGFQTGTGTNYDVFTAVVQPDSRILIGGSFDKYNGILRYRIARLLPDGSLDTTFTHNAGANNVVWTITLLADGRMVIGGGFDRYNALPRYRVARLNADGSLDMSFATGSGADHFVYTTTLQPDGKIILGGNFTHYDGQPRNYLVRLRADGSLDPGFTPGAGTDRYVMAAAVQADGDILIGGAFTSYNGVNRNRIARVTGGGATLVTNSPGVSAVCAGSPINIPFTAAGTFAPGNVFTAQLSDATGSFANPISIGTLAGTGSGSISALIPGSTPSGGGYRVRVTSTLPATSGLDFSGNLTIGTTPAIIANASATTICLGSSVTLTAAGAGNFSWASGNGLAAQSGASVTATPTAAGTYSYSVTGGITGCSAMETVSVNVLPGPLVTASPASVTIVAGTSTTMQASGAATYTWSTGQTGSSLTVSPAQSTTYIVTGSNPQGCTDTAIVTVTVLQLPTVLVSVSPAVICAGQSTVLSASGANSYQWTSGQTGSTLTVSPTVTTTYTVTGTAANGLTNTASITVTVNPVPAIPVITANTPCEGQSLQLQASLTPGLSYSWTGPGGFNSSQPTPVIAQVTAQQAGLYTLTVSNASGCSSQSTYLATVSPLPDSTFAVTGTSPNYTFTANGTGTYNWSFPGGNPASSTAQSVTVTYSGAGSFPVSLVTTSSLGCQAAATQMISILGNADNKVGYTHLFPNPTRGDLLLTLEAPFHLPASLRVLNILGQSVREITLSPGQQEYPLTITGLEAGTYVIWLQTEGRMEHWNVILQP